MTSAASVSSSSVAFSTPLSTLVSVAVTTKNEARNIERCLRSIQLQTWPYIEMIVVDNNSSDATKELARKFTPLVFDKGPERSAQRNYGMMDAAHGQLVMYVDADMILTPDLVEKAVNRMSQGNCDALYISEVILGKTYWCRVRRFERSFYDGSVVDCVRLFNSETFRRLGGFDETINGPEDWDMDKKVRHTGKSVLLDPRREPGDATEWELRSFIVENGVEPHEYGAVVFHNESNFRFWPYLKKKKYYSKGFDTYVAKWGKSDPDIRRQFGFAYRYFVIFTENGNWKKLLRHPLLALGMFLLRFMVGVVFIVWSLTPSRKGQPV